MSKRDPIQVWPFYDAPAAFRKLSTHGGDEDWLALVPKRIGTMYVPWLQVPAFGVCDVSEHPLPDGSRVFIGAHA